MKKIDDSLIIKVLIGIVIFLLLVIIALLVYVEPCDEEINDNSNIATIDNNKNEENFKDNVNTKVRVDIKGAVKKSGVYEVDIDACINDVLKLAGGLKSNASTKYINLSKKVSDEMVITIYTNNEVKKMENSEIKINDECICPDIDIKECDNSSVIVSNGDYSSTKDDVIDNDSEEKVTKKISINNASKEELLQLSGIGESKALAIIEYRSKNNGFKKIEDILNVSGIGEALYNKIKDDITL